MPADVDISLFVGFFGSPSWETSVMNLVSVSQATNSDPHLSFSSYDYSAPRRSKSFKTPHSSLSNKSSALHAKASSFTKSMAGGSYKSYPLAGDIAQLVTRKNTETFSLPAQPSPIYDAFSSKITRRFSMPSVPGLHHASRRVKRASSVDSHTARFDLHMSCMIENPSLRLVHATGNQDQLLPLSPEPNLTSDFRLSIDRFPVHPFLALRRKSATQDGRDQGQNLNKCQISHPFPLTLKSTSSRMSSPSVNVSPNIPRYDQGSKSIPKSPPPVVVSINLSPLSVPCPPATAELETLSRSPRRAAVFPNFRPKESRKSSLRAQRSPAIGPSPLRTMIHPDPSDPKVALQAIASRHNSADAKFDHSTLGLGFPKSPSILQSNNQSASGERRNLSEDSSKPRRATLPTRDSHTLSGLIRELIEETDHWDGSLFKDKHFKAMIDDSKDKRKTEDVSPRYDFTIRRDESTEVDLSLLGLDIFRSGGETFIPGAEDRHINEAQPSSFWEGDSIVWDAKKDSEIIV
ncbi:hypothetical protein H0H92_009073 [Tricholoma furcatifolium]|nr:hypothetical protein H0H92_009073 [Tricholoma furcatifolium]